MLSRAEQLRRDKVIPGMPPNPAPHLIERLIEIGLTEPAGMGVGPLSWGEIDAWCNRTKVDLAPWEARLIRSLSTAYVVEGRRAENESAAPPWRAPVTAAERAAERRRLEMVLG